MKRIVEDYEAKLRPSPDGPGSGKAEWERYGNHDVELSVRFRKLDAPDGATIDVRVDGCTIGSIVVKQGSGRLELESADGVTVPHGVDGKRIELLHGGAAVLSGTFRPD